MNSEDIRSVTGGNNIEVSFGGHIWNVVALTTTGAPTDVTASERYQSTSIFSILHIASVSPLAIEQY